MANYVYIATSLDGFIATVDGGVEWLAEVPNPEGSDFGFVEFMEQIDALVMGRNSFEKVLTFGEWPYDVPVYVLSNRGVEIPEELSGSVAVMNGTPEEVVQQLNRAGHQNLYIDGGMTIQRFLGADLIDHLIVTRIPILLGEGIPLFGKLEKPLRFEHVESKVYADALVKSHYKRMRNS